MRTAGRTVAFSALTVAVSLSRAARVPARRSCASSPTPASRWPSSPASFAVVVLPALLAVLGHRVDKLAVFKRRRTEPTDEGFWHRMAHRVMRRPVPIATAVDRLLLFLGAPFLAHRVRRCPTTGCCRRRPPARQVARRHPRRVHAREEAGALAVVAADIGDPAARAADIDAYADDAVDAARRRPRRRRRPAPTAATGSPTSAARRQLVARRLGRYPLRDRSRRRTYLSRRARRSSRSRRRASSSSSDVRAPPTPRSTCRSAGSRRSSSTPRRRSFGRLPLAAGAHRRRHVRRCCSCMFGSVLVPVKALVLNLLSLTATFGAMVWIFQDGHLAGLLGFTADRARSTRRRRS